MERIRSKQHFGIHPATIVLPLDLNKYLTLLQQAINFQRAFTSLIEQIDNHFSSSPIFQYFL